MVSNHQTAVTDSAQPSYQVLPDWDMKMRNLLIGVALGLLAVVHSTPLTNVTQDDVYREVVTDGYLIDRQLLSSPPKKSRERNTTAKTLTPEIKESDVIEGSGDANDRPVKHFATTVGRLSHPQGPHTKVTPMDTDESGSGDLLPPLYTMTNSGMSSTFPTSTTLPTSSSTLIREATPGGALQEDTRSDRKSESRRAGHLDVMKDAEVGKITDEDKTSNIAESSSGWVIIVGFVAGVAVLLILCVAIATRDKWNRPRQQSQPETGSNQPRELEMQTFLHKDQPKENGRTGEYTVIPLEEVPQKNSPH